MLRIPVQGCMVNQNDSALCFVCLIRTGEQDFFSAQFLDLICKLALWNPKLKAFQMSGSLLQGASEVLGFSIPLLFWFTGICCGVGLGWPLKWGCQSQLWKHQKNLCFWFKAGVAVIFPYTVVSLEQRVILWQISRLHYFIRCIFTLLQRTQFRHFSSL